jgi:hypothetical protein
LIDTQQVCRAFIKVDLIDKDDKQDYNVVGEEARVKDYRDIPVEVLRDFALSQTEASSIRSVADEVGLSHSALHKFVTGRTNPQPRVRRLLGLWYLQKVEQAHDIDVARPYAAALKILLSEIPHERRQAAEQEVLDALAQVHTPAGEPPPRWLELLRTHGR